MPVSKVTRNYQITIPKEVRERLGINVGDVLIVDVEGNKVVLRKEKLELPVFRGGKGLSVEKIEESIKRGMRDK
jgi:AbrB family looped-hinge helix DNA binding protein